MKHYILSRFNSEPIDWLQRRQGKFLNEAWLRRRLELSRQFYRPSLENQVCKDFHVVVACHQDSPAWVLNFFGEFAQIHFGQIFTFPFEPNSITTRLDTDDLIHQNFTQRVREIAESAPQETALVDFDTAGYNAATGEAWRIERRHNNSQFLSVTCSTPSLNCYSCAHTNMPDKFRGKRQYRINLVGGVQVLHDANILSVPANPDSWLELNLSYYGVKENG